MNFAERAAANVLFGGLPEGASIDNAINCFQTALKFEPNYILYMYDLAGAYFHKDPKDIANCKKWLDKALSLKRVTLDDPKTLEECRKMKTAVDMM